MFHSWRDNANRDPAIAGGGEGSSSSSPSSRWSASSPASASPSCWPGVDGHAGPPIPRPPGPGTPNSP